MSETQGEYKRNLMVAEKRLNSLFCEMMESILIIDASKGTIIWTNPHACTTFGFVKRGLEGKHFSDRQEINVSVESGLGRIV
jgi:hypothetical protein